jgi:Family of unknown function (DUF6084)
VPDLNLTVEGVSVVPFAVTPMLAFALRAVNRPAEERIHTAVLRSQIQLEVTRRHYSPAEEARLLDLFGQPGRWGQTLRTMLWTHATVVLPTFAGETMVNLQVPCTWDFNVAAMKYFHGLEDGEVPLSFLFSGSIFYQGGPGGLQVAPVSWETEARFRLPVRAWRELMEAYYPNVAWLELRRDVFERLYAYKVQAGIPTWEQVLERMLGAASEEARL